MQFTHTWRIIESTDLRDFPPRQPRTDFHQYHTDAPLEKSSTLHIPANFLLDVLFDQLRKGMSGFVCRTTVWEQNADKSIIFALEAAKVMPILPHSMTGMNNHCPTARNFHFGNTKCAAFSKQSY